MSASVEQRTVAVRGGDFQIDLLASGAGPPLLYLHSEWGRPWDAFLGSLAESYRVLAPSHPGVGNSTGTERLQDLTDLIYYYLDFLDSLELRNLPLVGHGLGGMIAAELAAVQPERFSRLVLIAPLGLWNPAYPVLDFFATEPADLGRALFHDPESPIAQAATAIPTDNDAYVRFMLDRAKGMAVAAKYLWPIPNRGLNKRLHRVRTPTLLVWGESDRLCPPAYGQDFLRLLPNARLEIIPGAGHLPQTEQPTTLAKAVNVFLAQRQ
jgi:pimeloyl-ACP methyl ester carboxylesterase